MPNYCNYEMKIKGSKDAIKRVIECLKADYNYLEGKPEHKHFFRIFDVDGDEDRPVCNGNGIYTQTIWGYCAWSIHSCMCRGEHSYYEDCKANNPEIFMGTDLIEQSQDCEIEVFGEEEGMEFSEHYVFRNGKCILDDCVDTKQAGYTKTGKVTTKINWDNYDGDIICLNPHRENLTEDYCWLI